MIKLGQLEGKYTLHHKCLYHLYYGSKYAVLLCALKPKYDILKVADLKSKIKTFIN